MKHVDPRTGQCMVLLFRGQLVVFLIAQNLATKITGPLVVAKYIESAKGEVACDLLTLLRDLAAYGQRCPVPREGIQAGDPLYALLSDEQILAVINYPFRIDSSGNHSSTIRALHKYLPVIAAFFISPTRM